jgi:hypothetical protein
VTIELSNSNSKFWKALGTGNLTHENYRNHPEIVGKILLDLVTSWHEAENIAAGGRIDLTKSSYLVLSWDERSGVYQLHQFSLKLASDRINWHFPSGGKRLKGDDNQGTAFEWYGESGGQLKYYPHVDEAVWASEPFKLEPLPSNTLHRVLASAADYFPELWSEANKHENA